jgi:glucose/arabinose dehydrogenase
MKFTTASALSLLACQAASAQTFKSSAGELKVETVAAGLVHPWGLQFLPDRRMLVTERPGRMRIVTSDGKLSPPIRNVPPVVATGQAGLLDVALDRQFATNRTIYFCFTYERGGNAAVARAELSANETPQLDNVKVIYRAKGPGGSNNHGCRIAQGSDSTLFVTQGDNFEPRDSAQDLSADNGKIIRIGADGAIPKDNPFVDRTGARPEIWSYGHRNPQGLTFNPATGKLWEQEHGPRGGDEVNVIEKGRNYGWPIIGYGIDYSGARIHESTHKAGMEQPLKYWVPSIAPSGMAFYEGDLFPAWKGNLFIGALKAEMLVRLPVQDETITDEERLLHALGERIRDVRNGPDGALYLLTDNSKGRILKVVPAK